MRNTQRGAFTREERKVAMWALLIAAVVAAMAMAMQQPSLGPWSAEKASAAMPGVLDAQPVTSGL